LAWTLVFLTRSLSLWALFWLELFAGIGIVPGFLSLLWLLPWWFSLHVCLMSSTASSLLVYFSLSYYSWTHEFSSSSLLEDSVAVLIVFRCFILSS
jgi:hypothetical protein